MFYAANFCTYSEETRNGVHGYVFTGPCMRTKKQFSVFAPSKGLYAYRQGASVQNAFPDMPADQREFLISGYSPKGWDLVFKDNQ